MLPSISSMLFPFHQKCPGKQDSHGLGQITQFLKVNQLQKEDF